MVVTDKTNLKEIYEEETLRMARRYLIGNGEAIFKESITLQDLNNRQPTWNPKDMSYGLNRLLEISQKEDMYLYQVYSKEEIEKDQDKKDVQLFHFPGNEEGRFAIILAGGAYGCVCSMVEAFPIAAKLNEMGFTAFCLNYRTAQPGLLPKPMDDLAAAYRFIEKNSKKFCVNPHKYIVSGFSAGGHTAAAWGTKELGFRKYDLPAPEMLMLGYPFITTVNMYEDFRDLFLLGMLGEKYTEETMNTYNINQHVDSEYPSVYIVQSQDDNVVPFYDSECLIEALKNEGIVYCAEQPKTGGHGFGLGSETLAEGWIERAVAFWENKMKKA